jgi:hypothetical protein
MRSLSLRLLVCLSLLCVPFAVSAANVTVTGTTNFTSLDGSPDDEDHIVNGVFTVSGDLTVNGSVNCNDTGGSSSACAMSFHVGRDLTINAGGAMFAENRSGSGTGGAITLTVGRNFAMHGAAGSLAAAVVSSNAKSSSASSGGAITANVVGTVAIDAGATIDAGAANSSGGSVTITAGGHIDVNGNVLSGPSRTLLATRLTGQALDGGTTNQSGGEIRILSTTFVEPGINVGSDANVIAQGDAVSSGPVTIEGCGIIVKGHVAALARKNVGARVAIRSGKNLLIDARDLGVSGATLGRNGHVRVDAPTGAADLHRVDLFAAGKIEVFGPDATSALYAISGLPGVHDAKSDGASIRITSTGDAVTASGNLIDDGRTNSGDGGGNVDIAAKGNVTLDTARMRVVGDSNTNNSNRNGGHITVRSHSGNIVWTNGIGDVTPAGSQVSAAQTGAIALTACGTITTSGSSFPTNGAPVGAFPATTTGSCSPAAPSLPAGEPVLPICNTPPTANPATASTLEDHSVTVTMSGSDPDAQPLTFTILTPPAHGSLGPVINPTPTSAQVVYTPNADYNGTDSFTFLVDDGNGGTATGTATITITAVNDAPSFNVGTSPQTSLEDGGPQFVSPWISGISAGPADEASQHVTFQITSNSNAALFSAGPSVTPSGALTYTAAPNANGSATLTVVAHDDGGTANGGVDTSASQTFTINITAVNDAPSFTKGADQSVFEDSGAQSVAAWATAISAGPADESGQSVSFTASNDNNALFSVQPAVAPNGTLTYTPAANANGSATVTVAAHDDGGTANGGVDTSAAQTFTITVGAVNDAPSFTKGADQTSLEDSGAQSVSGWATAISAGPADESSQVVTFTSSNDNNALFSTQPSVASDGTLTYTAAANAFGSATVTVTAHDDGGTANGGVDTSASQTFTITITPVNDAPSFTKGGDQSSFEDAGAQSVAAWATAISAGPGEGSQSVDFIVTNDNNTLFSVQPAVAPNGTLTYTSAPNANGTATVTVAIHDDGGTANGGVDTSATQTFTITVGAVNDAPSFTKGANQTVLEDAGAQTVAGWATAISAGPADESSQSVTFTATNNNNVLFTVQPAVDAAGNLTWTGAPDAYGTATVSVTAHDDGGTANGGVDASAPQTFTITITPVNDAPSFTKGADVSVSSNAGAQSFVNWATAISAGPNEAGQTVSFLVSNDNNAIFTAQPAVTSSGTLTFTTQSSAPTTTVHVVVAAKDDGGTANGGVDTSASQTFNINVTHSNTAPVANADSFDAIGNTELAVGTAGAQPATLVATGSVLANDTDADADSLTASAGSFTAGASLTVNSDGSFRYIPPAGFTGNDSFTYSVSDGQATSVGTVTIHVTKRVLYVNNTASAGGNGRVDSPYDTLSIAAAAAVNNDTIYVHTGDGTTSKQNVGVTLSHNGERLIGEGVVLTVSGTWNGVVDPSLRAAGTRPKLSNPAGDGVTVTNPLGPIATLEVSGVEVSSASANGVRIALVTGMTMNGNKITATANSGVKGTGVNGFSFTNGVIDGSGTGVDESNIAFNNATGNNLSGAVTITGNSFANALYHGIDVRNTSGTITNFVADNNTFTSGTTSVSSRGSAVRLQFVGAGASVASLTRGSISNNVIHNFPAGSGIIINGGNSVSTAPGATVGVPGSTTNRIVVNGNTISGGSSAVPLGSNAIAIALNGVGQGNFVVTNNGTAASPVTNIAASLVSLGVFGNATATASVSNNYGVLNNTLNSAGISIGVDQAFGSTDSGSLTIDIIGNTLRAVQGNGILATARNSNGSLGVRIQNNDVAAPTSGVRQGIRVDSGTTIGNNSVCLDISGNISAGSGGAKGIGLRKQGTAPGIAAFGITGMAATATPGVEAYVNGLNPAASGTTLISATSGFTSCSLP